MTDKRYIVPEGMLQAGRAVYSGYVTAEEGARVILEAALRWQDGELEKMIQGDPYANDRFMRSETLNENACRTGFNQAIHEVRRMFLAPEPEYKDGTVIWKEGTTIPLGVWSGGKMYTTNIPTSETQADNSCPACDHGQSLERGEGTHREGTKQHPIAPEVPEVIKDLMVGLSYPETTLTMKQGDFDMRVLEAYRRGKDNPIK